MICLSSIVVYICRELEKEKRHLTESKNQLSADLERLLGQRQVLSSPPPFSFLSLSHCFFFLPFHFSLSSFCPSLGLGWLCSKLPILCYAGNSPTVFSMLKAKAILHSYYASYVMNWLTFDQNTFVTSNTMAKVSSSSEGSSTTSCSEVDISSHNSLTFNTSKPFISILDQLKPPKKSDLAWKQKIEWSQCSGRTKKARAPNVMDLENVTPAQRIRQFPNECLVVLVITAALVNNVIMLSEPLHYAGNVFTELHASYYAKNYAGIICQGLLLTHPLCIHAHTYTYTLYLSFCPSLFLSLVHSLSVPPSLSHTCMWQQSLSLSLSPSLFLSLSLSLHVCFLTLSFTHSLSLVPNPPFDPSIFIMFVPPITGTTFHEANSPWATRKVRGVVCWSTRCRPVFWWQCHA